jgi:hypothetical protein
LFGHPAGKEYYRYEGKEWPKKAIDPGNKVKEVTGNNFPGTDICI